MTPNNLSKRDELIARAKKSRQFKIEELTKHYEKILNNEPDELFGGSLVEYNRQMADIELFYQRELANIDHDYRE